MHFITLRDTHAHTHTHTHTHIYIYIYTHTHIYIYIYIYTHTHIGRTSLGEGLARRSDFYLTTHSTHKRRTSIPPAGFEKATPASKRPQTHDLDRAATGIGIFFILLYLITDRTHQICYLVRHFFTLIPCSCLLIVDACTLQCYSAS